MPGRARRPRRAYSPPDYSLLLLLLLLGLVLQTRLLLLLKAADSSRFSTAWLLLFDRLQLLLLLLLNLIAGDMLLLRCRLRLLLQHLWGGRTPARPHKPLERPWPRLLLLLLVDNTAGCYCWVCWCWPPAAVPTPAAARSVLRLRHGAG